MVTVILNTFLLSVSSHLICVFVLLCKGLHAHECYKVTVYALFKDGRSKKEFYIATQPQGKAKQTTYLQ